MEKQNIQINYNQVTPLNQGLTYCYKQDNKLYLNLSMYVINQAVIDKDQYVSVGQLVGVAPSKTVWLPAVLTMQPEKITGSTDDGSVEFGVIRINTAGNIHSFIPYTVARSINCFHINAVIDLQ